MALPFDSTLKSLVAARPGDFASVFGLPTDEVVRPVNVDLSTISAATDVALAYGKPIREIVDLNFQTGPDVTLPSRLHLYSAALHRLHRVPVRTLLVLLRSQANTSNLTGVHAYGAGSSGVEFRYEVIRLWQVPVESILHAGLSALPLATLCQMPAGEPLPDAMRNVVLEIQRRLGNEASHEEASRLLTASFILSGLRTKNPVRNSIYRGVGVMNELTAYDEAVEEGEQRGKVIQSHAILLRVGRKQFGPPDETTEVMLKSIQDLDHLNRLTDAILAVKSWSELLATP
jgi:hypothetical protein